AVIAQSFWRPGQPLVIDGLRHAEVFNALRNLLKPMDVFEIYLDADIPTREARLRERGEVHVDGVKEIDSHIVEQQLLTILPGLAERTMDANGPENEQVDELV